MQLGYEINIGPKGTFEIKDVSPELIQAFSKRRHQIRTWLDDRDLSGGEAATVANFQTRRAKQSTPLEKLEDRWLQELENHGSSIEKLQQHALTARLRGPVLLPDPALIAENAVIFAIEHLSEWKTHFALKDIMDAAKALSLIPNNDADCLKSIESRAKTSKLIYIGEGKFTTPKAAQLENENNLNMQQGKEKVSPILINLIAKYIANRTLTEKSEQEALKFMLTSKDQQILISSHSKERLHEILKVFNTVSEDQKYYPRLLVSRTNQCETLKDSTGMSRVIGIDEFLLSREIRMDAKDEKASGLGDYFEQLGKPARDWQAKEIWVVQADLSLKQINRLQYWAKTFSVRIIFAQTSKNEALKSLIKAGIAHKTLENVPNHPSHHKDVLTFIKDLETEKSLIAIPDFEKRTQAAVDEWLKEREQGGLLFTSSRQDYFRLNQAAREALIQRGVLSNKISTEILSPVTLSVAQKSALSSFQLGDMIYFKRGIKDEALREQYFSIHRIDIEKGLIEIHHQDQAVLWDPSQTKASRFEVFKKETRNLSIGESIRWTKTIKDKDDPKLNLTKHHSATVISIDDKIITASLHNKEAIKLDLTKTEAMHWEYGYATLAKDLPVHFKSAIGLVNSHTLDYQNLKDLQETFRSVKSLSSITVLCDNSQKLTESIQRVNSEWRFQGEMPYDRAEALQNDQSIATQPLFHRLQSAYLSVSKSNPELNQKSINEPQYSAEFRKAANIVDTIALRYSEREAVFSLEAIKKEGCETGGLHVSTEMIREAFDAAIAQGWLVPVTNQKRFGTMKSTDVLVTTKAMLAMEKLTVKKMLANQNAIIPIIATSDPILKTVDENFWLTEGQKVAITLAVTSSDRIIGIQGVAGAGKTTALKEINRLCEGANYSVLVIANTASAKNRAMEASEIPAMTTRQFLSRAPALLLRSPEEAKKIFGGNRLIVLDEASLASTQDVFQLSSVVEQLGARLCLMGDIKQMGSIEAGRIFYSLIAYGLKTAVMGENVRFKDPNTVAVMQDIYAARIQDALEKLSDSILEIPDKKEALEKIVDIYCASKKEVQENTLIITPLNQDRVFINNAIREQFKKTEVLTGSLLNTRVLLPKDVHQVDKTDCSSFEVGDTIRFNAQNRRSGIEMGDYAKIIGVEPRAHRLRLQLESGREIYWAPKNLKKESDIEIYRTEQREWLKNDVIIFKRNNEPMGIYNGDKAKILKIEGSKTELLLNNGKTLPLDLSLTENQHLDYGYTVTAYPAQGRDVPFVLAYSECPKPHLKKTEQLKVGDCIILPKKEIPDPGKYSENSKVVTIQKVEGSKLTLVDRHDYHYALQTKPEQTFGYFPPFEERKAKEIPKSTSQQSFLMEVTRGDLTFLVVNNVDDFQKTLISREPKDGVLKHLDPLWPIRAEMVESLTSKVTGRAKPEKQTPISVIENAIPQENKSPTSAKILPISNRLYANNGRINAEELNRRLENNLLSYATTWLGKPTRITGREARWGTKGSFSLLLNGSKIGAWCDFESGESGKGLIALYSHIHKIPWKDALKDLAKEGGVVRPEDITIKKPKKLITPEKDPKTRIQEAQTLYQKGVPIPGTLAEKYLREFRSIPGPLPEDFRFKADLMHPFTRKLSPALLVPIKDKNQKLIGVESIFLDEKGDKLKGTFYRNGVEEKIISKISFGVKSGGAVTVQKANVSRVLWIAEGIETALSVAKAMPNHTVVASLSAQQLKNVPLSPETQKVIICADNDGSNANSQKAVIKAIERHLSQGRQVYLTMPLGNQKQDFNDLMKQGGISAVHDALEKVVEIKDVGVLKTGDLKTIIEKSRISESREIKGLDTSGSNVKTLQKKGLELER